MSGMRLANPLRTTAMVLLLLLLVLPVPVYGDEGLASSTGMDSVLEIAPGVSYRALDVPTARGTARAHIVEVDMSEPKVTVDLLYTGVVAQGSPLSKMADAQGAVAAVNGDFFNISATQPGVVPTNAPVGPAIASGEILKGAVPTRQRFGPSLPIGVTVEDVIGVGTDGVGRLGRLTLQGAIVTPYGAFDLGGLNQYAIPMSGIGAFDARWGSVSRLRAVCGTDSRREDPCSKDMHEVTVTQGVVTAASPQPGSGSIPEGTVVLIGRETGAARLRQLQIGDQVQVSYSLVSSEQVPFEFAVGGHPIIRDGKAIVGLDNTTAAIRSAAGLSADGRTLFLLALDRNATGLTYAELATVLLAMGVESGINLDGGGSSTLVVRQLGATSVTVKNLAPGDAERAIPNSIGVFVRP